MAKPPKDVDASTSRRTRLGYENAICCATAPPNEAPSTWADSMPSSSSTSVPKRASAHMVSGKAGHLRPADARRVEGDRAEPVQMGKQLFPQAHLAPDAGEEQQRLAFAADLSMDPQPPDA